MKSKPIFLIFLIISVTLFANKTHLSNLIKPTGIIEIKLDGNASLKRNEFSGLAWYGNKLVLLPQYIFNKQNTAYGKIYLIPRKNILNYLNGKINKIKPQTLSVVTKGFEKFGRRGSGCESITFSNDTCFVTVEISEDTGTYALLIKGVVKAGKLIFQNNPIAKIPSQTNLFNISDETILETGNKIITIHEANGANVNFNPVAHLFNKRLRLLSEIPFPTIEYRITDATNIDKQNDFWVINYFFPGDYYLLKPATDKIEQGKFNKRKSIERLIELHYSKNGITRTTTPPVNLISSQAKYSRNWEGIAKLDDKGFLIITDTYPRTIFAFVPYQLKH